MGVIKESLKKHLEIEGRRRQKLFVEERDTEDVM